MPYVYWIIVVIIELIVVCYGVRWICGATEDSYAPLQPGCAVIYSILPAMLMLAVGLAAYFGAYLLGNEVPLIIKVID